MSFYSTDSGVYEQQLQVQELCIRFSDTNLYSVSSDTVTVDVKQNVLGVACALFVDDSAGTVAPVQNASQSITGSQISCTLSAAFAAHDCLILKYIVQG